MKEFLLGRIERVGGDQLPGTRVFTISDARHALSNACKRLPCTHYTQRNLRSMRITDLLDAGVGVKMVAEWQGHKDGSKLILEAYSQVQRERGAADSRERKELDKLFNRPT